MRASGDRWSFGLGRGRAGASPTVAWCLGLWLAFSPAGGARAYQTYGTVVGSNFVTLRWGSLPVRYFITDREVIGVTATQFRDTAGQAFAAWGSVRAASVSAEFVGFTGANPLDEDGQTTLGFLNRPDLDRVLGATQYLIDESTGAIVEADIFFNSAFSWSVAVAGEAGRYDLQSIMVHEMGHLFGLGHSGLGETELLAGGGRRVVAAESVMFPIAFPKGTVTGRTLQPDDVAGLAQLYPAGNTASKTGSVSGRVTKGGAGVFGAHVVAFNTRTGTMVGHLTTDENGTFVIGSLEPGVYILRVEPLDDADLESFFAEEDVPKVDVDFKVAYASGLAIVPAGGGSLAAEIAVVPK